MIVLDASAALEALIPTRDDVGLSKRLAELDEPLHAPHLLDVEFTQVLRRFAARGEISEARGRRALRDLAALSLTRHAHTDLLPRIWRLRANLTAYDATYVALAESLDARLITRDARLAAAPGHHARIELI